LFITIINLVVGQCIIFGAKHTRSKSVASMTGKIIFWTYVSQFLNTGLIPLFTHSAYEIDDAWFKTIGMSLIANNFMNIIIPPATSFITPYANKVLGEKLL